MVTEDEVIKLCSEVAATIPQKTTITKVYVDAGLDPGVAGLDMNSITEGKIN